jgi:hypothetical protein
MKYYLLTLFAFFCANVGAQSYLLKNGEKGSFLHGVYVPSSNYGVGVDLAWDRIYLSGAYNITNSTYGGSLSYLIVKKKSANNIFSIPLTAGVANKYFIFGGGLAYQIAMEENYTLTPTISVSSTLTNVYNYKNLVVTTLGASLRLGRIILTPQYNINNVYNGKSFSFQLSLFM